jgi:hypothetical protein
MVLEEYVSPAHATKNRDVFLGEPGTLGQYHIAVAVIDIPAQHHTRLGVLR